MSIFILKLQEHQKVLKRVYDPHEKSHVHSADLEVSRTNFYAGYKIQLILIFIFLNTILNNVTNNMNKIFRKKCFELIFVLPI